MIAFYPNAANIANDERWDGVNYSIKSNLNVYCTITITFDNKYCVAVFRDGNSKRILSNEFEDPKEYFKGTLKIIERIAEHETLSDLFYFAEKKSIPKVTTAFWGYKNVIFSLDNYENIIENGGKIIKDRILPYEESLKIYKKQYDMTDKQVNLLEKIYLRKMQNPKDIVKLTESERNMIDSTNNIEGIVRSKFSFARIGIDWA